MNFNKSIQISSEFFFTVNRTYSLSGKIDFQADNIAEMWKHFTVNWFSSFISRQIGSSRTLLKVCFDI